MASTLLDQFLKYTKQTKIASPKIDGIFFRIYEIYT